MNNDMFKAIYGYTSDISCSPNAQTNFRVNFTVPTGYKALTVTGWDISGASGLVHLYAMNVNSVCGKTGEFSEVYWVYNSSSASRTVRVDIGLLCQKII